MIWFSLAITASLRYRTDKPLSGKCLMKASIGQQRSKSTFTSEPSTPGGMADTRGWLDQPDEPPPAAPQGETAEPNTAGADERQDDEPGAAGHD
jgi:hypothetical protein